MSPSKTTSPSRRPTNRLPNSRAKSKKCRFTSVVIPISRLMRCRSPMTCLLVTGSRAATGSSASITAGSWARARAMPTRCCCPPDRLEARTYAFSTMPTRSRAWRAASRSADGQSPRVDRQAGTADRRPISTLFSTEVRCTRLNVWKIIPIRERMTLNSAAPAPTTSVPSMVIDPEVAGTRPFRARRSVDLPAPESPTTTTNSPSSTRRSTLRSA